MRNDRCQTRLRCSACFATSTLPAFVEYCGHHLNSTARHSMLARMAVMLTTSRATMRHPALESAATWVAVARPSAMLKSGAAGRPREMPVDRSRDRRDRDHTRSQAPLSPKPPGSER